MDVEEINTDQETCRNNFDQNKSSDTAIFDEIKKQTGFSSSEPAFPQPVEEQLTKAPQAS